MSRTLPVKRRRSSERGDMTLLLFACDEVLSHHANGLKGWGPFSLLRSPSERGRSVAASSGLLRAGTDSALAIFGKQAPHQEGLWIVLS
jgi:hypothetical protein